MSNAYDDVILTQLRNYDLVVAGPMPFYEDGPGDDDHAGSPSRRGPTGAMRMIPKYLSANEAGKVVIFFAMEFDRDKNADDEAQRMIESEYINTRVVTNRSILVQLY